jgi:hypothetical protein
VHVPSLLARPWLDQAGRSMCALHSLCCATHRCWPPVACLLPLLLRATALQVLTGQSLATFSLVDSCQSLLGSTLEVLGPHHLAALWQQAHGPPPPQQQQLQLQGACACAGPAPGGARGAAARLAAYTLRRVDVMVRLMGQLATLPEALEMARVTGLTLPQVCVCAGRASWAVLPRC